MSFHACAQFDALGISPARGAGVRWNWAVLSTWATCVCTPAMYTREFSNISIPRTAKALPSSATCDSHSDSAWFKISVAVLRPPVPRTRTYRWESSNAEVALEVSRKSSWTSRTQARGDGRVWVVLNGGGELQSPCMHTCVLKHISRESHSQRHAECCRIYDAKCRVHLIIRGIQNAVTALKWKKRLADRVLLHPLTSSSQCISTSRPDNIHTSVCTTCSRRHACWPRRARP